MGSGRGNRVNASEMGPWEEGPPVESAALCGGGLCREEEFRTGVMSEGWRGSEPKTVWAGGEILESQGPVGRARVRAWRAGQGLGGSQTPSTAHGNKDTEGQGGTGAPRGLGLACGWSRRRVREPAWQGCGWHIEKGSEALRASRRSRPVGRADG